MAYYAHSLPRRELIVGYHGTSTSAAHAIMAEGFAPSTGPNEWLGHGVYFWNEIDAAWCEHRHKKCAVVEASLVLGNCLDLDNPGLLAAFLREVAAELDAHLAREKRPLPPSFGDDQRYNCELLNRAADSTFLETDSIIRTCAAHQHILGNSDLHAATRLQIISNLRQILNPVLDTKRP